jgi:hypothetical protein
MEQYIKLRFYNLFGILPDDLFYMNFNPTIIVWLINEVANG